MYKTNFLVLCLMKSQSKIMKNLPFQLSVESGQNSMDVSIHLTMVSVAVSLQPVTTDRDASERLSSIIKTNRCEHVA